MTFTMNWKRKVLVAIGVLIAGLTVALTTHAQTQQGAMYGKVITSKATYVGAIRWGNEEIFWTDLFNAAKEKNEYEKLVPKTKEESDWFSSYNWSFSSIWDDYGTTHQFVCQFGNIREIIPMGNRALLKLKNGGEIRVNGEGYNDIGGEVTVLDEELGKVSVDWNRIEKVEFTASPSTLESTYGKPLFGTVEGIRREKYTGYIIWDNDERVASDKLDGDLDGRDISIKFMDIVRIEKEDDGCMVRLKSGKELFINNSNDVDDGNRGVWVVNPEYGVIKFSWNSFRSLTLSEATTPVVTYDFFTVPKALTGQVSLLDGTDVTGRIIYDIDETLDMEVLEGKENDIEYFIPMRNIRRIIPKNSDYSMIELVTGKTLFLGGTHDVSEDNSGTLVFSKGKKDPRYIAWKKINEIIFN